MKTPRFGILFLIMVLSPAVTGAVDFGLLLNQYAGLKNSENNNFEFEYNAGLVPRFSLLIGDTGSFFLSAAMNIEYTDKFYFYPELLRTELFLNFGQIDLKAGRIIYSAPFDYIASGLFDGLQFIHSSRAGRFGLGAWYTGFQYKKSANITMTNEDQLLFNSEVDYNNFYGTYFAPKRLLVSINWEHPSIGEFLRVNTAVLGQIDFSKEGIYHNQYLMLKLGFHVNRFLFELGGSLEAAQMKRPEYSVDNEGKTTANIPNEFTFKMAFSGELGFYWTLPAKFYNRFSLVGRYTSGSLKGNEIFGAFIPVTSKNISEIFTPKMSGITVLTLDHSARIIKEFGTNINFSYFVRNDLKTVYNFPLADGSAEKKLLGGELYARLIFNPLSDLQIKLGGGAFFSQLGNVWEDREILLKMELNAIFSLY
ncbi:MAG: hypothetical protein FWC19_06685 [Treponema sp.]|nr:hypothetical protein [Treponema sp.]MCL2272471.1 hypothetical protein [Treponema sp.]